MSNVHELASRSTRVFAKTFFPDVVYEPFTAGHQLVMDALDYDPASHLLIVAPRGFAKTTMVMQMYPLRLATYGKINSALLVGPSFESAMGHSEAMKSFMRNSTPFVDTFGDVMGKLWTKKIWHMRDAVGGDGCYFVPYGAGQKKRGIKQERFRPNLVVMDDMEDPRDNKNEDLREDLVRWYAGDVSPMVDPHNYRFIADGTITHEDCFLLKLAQTGEWKTIIVQMIVEGDDGELVSLWPERFPDEFFAKKRREFDTLGEIHVFYMEYLNKVVPGERAHFRQADFRYYIEDGSLNGAVGVFNFVLVDPARTNKATSDYTAIATVAIDPVGQRILIRDLVRERMHVDEIYDRAIDMAFKHRALAIGCEVTGANDSISQPFRNQIGRRGGPFKFIDLHAYGKKPDRIGAMCPYVRCGSVYLNGEVTKPLESEWLSYPRSQHDDASDCVGYTPQMMARLNIYFMPDALVEPYTDRHDYKKRGQLVRVGAGSTLMRKVI